MNSGLDYEMNSGLDYGMNSGLDYGWTGLWNELWTGIYGMNYEMNDYGLTTGLSFRVISSFIMNDNHCLE